MKSATSKFVLLFTILAMATSRSVAQDDAEFKMEIGGGLGTNFYLGDLNSKFYTNNTVAIGGTWRYLLDHRNAIKAVLTYAGVKGNNNGSVSYYPANPDNTGNTDDALDYAFSSHVVDMSCLYEINFWPCGYYKNYLGHKRVTPFLQLGLGLTYVGMAKSVTANIPMGAGIKYRLGKRLNMALDWRIHFSMSDEIDGLVSPLGIANESIKNKDNYQTTMLTITYSFAPICPSCNKDL